LKHEDYIKSFYYTKKTEYPIKLVNYLFNRFNLKEGMKLLDVGCGNEEHMSAFVKLKMKTYGIDSIKHINKKVKVCNLTKQRIPFSNNTFDVVFTKSCLEHLRPIECPMKQIKRVLKKNGLLIVMVPDWKSQYKNYYDGYDHITPFTRRGIKGLMNYVGFKDVECEYFYQLPFTWQCNTAKIIPKIISILPDRFMWKDEYNHRILIRFSKLKMLLAWGYKNE